MFGVLPNGAIQLPHSHESVALDFIIDCRPGCYTLIGRDLDDDGKIISPQRADWEPGSAFVTPPGLWHAHFNESGRRRPGPDPGRRPAYLSEDARHPVLPPAPRVLHLAQEGLRPARYRTGIAQRLRSTASDRSQAGPGTPLGPLHQTSPQRVPFNVPQALHSQAAFLVFSCEDTAAEV